MIISARSRNGAGPRVFFCRIAGYGETVAAFLRRYYEAARRSGVIIDGRIPNPTPDNLSYFNEMMGSGFQMDRDFLSQRLKKWLSRMTDGAAGRCGDGHVCHPGRYAPGGQKRQYAPQCLHEIHVLALLQVRADRQRAGRRDAAQDPLCRGREPL